MTLRAPSPRRIARALRRCLGAVSTAAPRRSGPIAVPADADSLLASFIAVTERFPRDYDPNYLAVRDCLRAYAASGTPGVTEFEAQWSAFSRALLSSPVTLQLLFPDHCSRDPNLVGQARKAINAAFLPAESARSQEQAAAQARLAAPGEANDRMLLELLGELQAADPAAGPPFRFLSRYPFLRDLAVAHFVRRDVQEVQAALFAQCCLQRQNWRHSYADDYPYQGLARLGVAGVKPGEERLARYDIDRFLHSTARVLDVGANNCFLSLAVAGQVGHVDAVEFNPYLCEMARIAARHLGIANVEAIVGDFVEFRPTHSYDAVFSLANHCTIDGNLSMDFEEYVAKCFSALKPDGFLFFESHNVFGPGKGGAGDDGDMDAKFDIVERYFEVVRYRMTQRYVPAFDIDKLFVVLRRRRTYQAAAQRTFRLADARQRYDY
jgi:SAM-dependent methyltransferase